MSTPTYVTVTRSYQSLSTGLPLAGGVTFQPVNAVTGQAVNIYLDGTLVAATQSIQATLDSAGSISVPLVATDSPGVSPSGWVWRVKEFVPGGSTYLVAPVVANAPTIPLDDLAPVTSPTAVAPTGVTELNDLTGAVTLLGDSSITVSPSGQNIQLHATATGGVTSVFGRTGAVTAQTGDYTAAQVHALPSTDDLSAIATANLTAGPVSMNMQKFTGLANGVVSTDSAAFGQIPTSAAQIGGLLSAQNLADLGSLKLAYFNLVNGGPVHEFYLSSFTGADPTGATLSDTGWTSCYNAAVAATQPSGPSGTQSGACIVIDGIYKVSINTVQNLNPLVAMRGIGNAQIFTTGNTGDIVRIGNTTGSTPNVAAPIYGFTINGWNAGASVNGLHYGDRNGGYLQVAVAGCNHDSSCRGFWFRSDSTGVNEKITAILDAEQNSINYDFDGNTASGSFDYSTWSLNTVTVANVASQSYIGVRFTNQGHLVGGEFSVRGNCKSTNASATATALVIGNGTADTAKIARAHLHWAVECAASTGTVTEMTIQGASSTGIVDCSGVMSYQTTGGTWTAGSLGGSAFLQMSGVLLANTFGALSGTYVKIGSAFAVFDSTGGAISGLVASLAAADGSIVIGGTASAPTVATGTLDVIASNHPPAANWSNNSKKITNLANGSASSDAAAFGQIPTTDQVDNPLALGAAAPGTTGKFTDQGHVHPTTGLLTNPTTTSKSASFNASYGGVYICTASLTATLPAPAASSAPITIVAAYAASPSSLITIAPHASETINGEKVLYQQYQSVTYVTDGTNWYATNYTGNFELRASGVYAPASETTISASSTTWVVVPTADVTMTFIAPPTGNIEISLQALVKTAAASDIMLIGVSSSSSSFTQVGNTAIATENTGAAGTTISWTITGLTNGNSYTYYFWIASGGSYASNIQAQGTTGSGATGSPLQWRIEAL